MRTGADLIFCSNREDYMQTAARYGILPGAQLPTKIAFSIVFADQDWKKPNREAYMRELAHHRPRLATVLDLEREDQFDEVMSWADEASRYVSEAVIIIPKVSGVIARLPARINGKSVRLGYSVPTRYGGTTLLTAEFGRWPVHLLGGSLKKQHELAHYLNVASADTNYTQKLANEFASYCTCFGNVEFRDDSLPPRARATTAFEMSCMNASAHRAGAYAQFRFASLDDLPFILKIAAACRHELGFVMPASLRESVGRRNLVVAAGRGGDVLGFANYRARRDGVQKIYQLAVDKRSRGQKLGAGLLACVPRPVELKCTTDNPANLFYAACGGRTVAFERGKKRPLNVWRFDNF